VVRPDPCAHEKPLYSVYASNVAQLSQPLSAGQFVTCGVGHTLLSTEHDATWRELATGTDQSLPADVELADGRLALVGPVSGFTATIRLDRLAATSLLPSDKSLLLFTQAGVRAHPLPGGHEPPHTEK
jgi:hypothetical protein